MTAKLQRRFNGWTTAMYHAHIEALEGHLAERESRLRFALKSWERGEIPPADMNEFEALFLEARADAEEET